MCLFPSEPTTQPMSGPAAMFLSLIKHLDARPLLQNIIMNINYNNGNSDKDDHADMWH